MKNLFITKITIIELLILFIFYILINKYCFILLLTLIMILLYKSNKASNIPLPKDIGNSTMNAFLENPNNASDSLKDKYIFQGQVKIPQLKSERDILIKVYSAALNEVDYIYLFSQFPFFALKEKYCRSIIFSNLFNCNWYLTPCHVFWEKKRWFLSNF